MTDHFQEIYRHQAENYERLVAREDYQQNILPALQQIRPLAGLEVVEMGAGTGRLTALLAPLVASIRAFDAAPAMLAVATAKLERLGRGNWRIEVADNAKLPLAGQTAGLAIAGWSFGHATGWYPDTWPEVIGQAVAEMKRVLRPGGTAIILETMGTGFETPRPPSPVLADYYAWLEAKHDFTATWVRTDYKFASLAEAEELNRFFFGEAMARQVIKNNWLIVPECTGIWWATV
jgi:ubiquinone/menaquinone biosynthesis C-methylase UbiE